MASPPPAAPPVLSFWEKSPPLAAIAAAHLSGVEITAQVDPKGTRDTVATLKFASGDELVGLPLILRYIARSSKAGQDGLYGGGALSACQVDYWLDYASSVVPGASFEAVCASIDSYLSLRTFLVDYTVTLADIVIWGQLLACPIWKKISSSGKVPHLARWFAFMSDVPQLKAASEQYDARGRPKPAAAPTTSGAAASGSDAGAPAKNAGDTGSFDVNLPNAVHGAVVTRFPPEPSGYLHVGHAKAALLNQHFADMYGGRLLVRFDDTNPSKEKDDYVENILKDIRDLGLRHDKVTYTSDYFPQMLELAEKLIKAGVLYADDTPVDDMRQQRTDGIESARRNRPVDENLRLFGEMQKGTEEGLINCLRFKMDMTALNKALRDPVAYRCNLTPHWRTGTKYKVYPTYDFACPFVDALEGVTHALRTSEYRDREAQYYWVLKEQQKVWPGLPHVNIWDYARLNFQYTVLSKRKLTWFVETGRVASWDDPRMPTVQGVLRRGMQIEALREFIISQGASKNITYQEWDKFWSINKRVIDPVCPRHTAIVTADRVAVTLTNGPAEPELVTVPKHKKYPPAGKKTLIRTSTIWLEQVDARTVTEGEEVTLMDWGNAFIRTITKDASGNVTSISAELHLEGDFKKTKLKLTWLADSDELVPLQLVDFDYLITKWKVDEEDEFETLVNEQTRFDTAAVGDTNMRSLQKGDIIQLERKGYYRVDEPLLKAGKPIVLFNIPDGRTKKSPSK